jgi:hypothetical protein
MMDARLAGQVVARRDLRLYVERRSAPTLRQSRYRGKDSMRMGRRYQARF